MNSKFKIHNYDYRCNSKLFERSSHQYAIVMALQQFGVIPFEIRTLKIGHTEQRRTQRFYIAEIVRHRGTVGAWRNRGYPQ